MAVPRIARVHLVYQFVILLLLQLTLILTLFALGYEEILPYKKYLFLALIPVFCYQLSIVFCCVELMPLPRWILAEPRASESQETETDMLKVAETFGIKQTRFVKPVLPRKRISFRNDLSSPKTEISSKVISPCREPRSPKNQALNGDTIDIKTCPKLENVKSVPVRQKRVEEWLESKEADRPNKVRSWKSTYGYPNSKPSVITTSPSFKIEDDKESESIDRDSDSLNVSSDLAKESSDIKKSYSYPFRLRKPDKMESNETLDSDFNIPAMPPWKALNYQITYERQRRKRKSISSEALDKELNYLRSQCQQECRKDLEFSQSVELPKPTDLEEDLDKKTNLKHVNSFFKIKQGIVNCFNKSKRDSVKTDEDNSKENVESKKPFFKELFLSREGLMFEPEKREDAARHRNLTRAKSESRDKHSSTYVSFQNDSFGKCTRSSVLGYKEFDRI